MCVYLHVSASCQCSRDCLGWEKGWHKGAQVQFFDSLVVFDLQVESKPECRESNEMSKFDREDAGTG